MEIVEIFKDHLYSVRHEGEADDEYSKAFDRWADPDYLVEFFKKHASCVEADIWQEAGLRPDNPYRSADRVASEASDLENHIRELASNSGANKNPDLDTLFRNLDGKYKFLTELVPQKSYGRYRPSLIRLYAIKLESNCYLIVYGGIKVGAAIQNSPVLDREVIPAIDRTLAFLKANGIVEQVDL